MILGCKNRTSTTPQFQKRAVEEFKDTVKMSDRPGIGNQKINTSEPRYTRAEVEVMINEMLAAKLVELGNTFPAQTQPSVSSLASGKGKEPEVFVPWLRKQDVSYHKGMLERVRPAEEVFDLSYASEKRGILS